MVDIKSTLTSISTSLTTEPIQSAATQEPLKSFVADLLTFVDEKLAAYTEQIAAVSGNCTMGCPMGAGWLMGVSPVPDLARLALASL